MGTIYPDKFPQYGVPWLIMRMVPKNIHDSIILEPVELNWDDNTLAIMIIGHKIDLNEIEIEFNYDGRFLTLFVWEYQNDPDEETPDGSSPIKTWAMSSFHTYDLLDDEESECFKEKLHHFLKGKTNERIKLQYFPDQPKG